MDFKFAFQIGFTFFFFSNSISHVLLDFYFTLVSQIGFNFDFWIRFHFCFSNWVALLVLSCNFEFSYRIGFQFFFRVWSLFSFRIWSPFSNAKWKLNLKSKFEIQFEKQNWNPIRKAKLKSNSKIKIEIQFEKQTWNPIRKAIPHSSLWIVTIPLIIPLIYRFN